MAHATGRRRVQAQPCAAARPLFHSHRSGRAGPAGQWGSRRTHQLTDEAAPPRLVLQGLVQAPQACFLFCWLVAPIMVPNDYLRLHHLHHLAVCLQGRPTGRSRGRGATHSWGQGSGMAALRRQVPQLPQPKAAFWSAANLPVALPAPHLLLLLHQLHKLLVVQVLLLRGRRGAGRTASGEAGWRFCTAGRHSATSPPQPWSCPEWQGCPRSRSAAWEAGKGGSGWGGGAE